MPILETVIWIALAVVLAAARSVAAEDSCGSLVNVKLDHASVTSATMVEAGPFKGQAPPGFPAQQAMVPRHCEVKGVARPTSDSEINFELWMPPADAWNGKFLQVGNGGWAGSIPTPSLIAPLARGYAVSGTDDGHRAQGFLPDASWAIGHPEKLIDFGHRSLHETAVHSKAILQAYFGKAAGRAYFAGCSDGGREALMIAQRYPEDFDGIVAGAPANYWSRLLTDAVWNEKALLETPGSDIPVNKLPAIQKAAMAACDALDGVKDGLIEDPRQCRFDPAVLKCSGADGPDCLTQPQIDALRKVYGGARNPRTGEQIHPGFEPGTEAEPGNWNVWLLGSIRAQVLFGNSYYSGAVYENPKWDWRTMDFDRDFRYAQQKTGGVLDSDSPDLRTFRAHGGKLIQYHGWGDAAIPPRDSIEYYQQVESFLDRYPDPRSPATRDVHSFYRLFMVPGMGHCAGGPGPTSFGNVPGSGGAEDADHDVLLALDRWVTQGIGPEKIIGAGKVGGVSMTRPLCPYPAIARYKGQGDTNSAGSFDCAVPKP